VPHVNKEILMTETERPQRLTAQKKFKLYLETRLPNAAVGEIIRRYGIHLDDLRQIEQVVESAAIAGLKATGRKQRLPDVVTPERIAQLQAEVAEKTTALAELSVAYTLLEKKVRPASNAHLRVASSRRQSNRSS
jgi:transposase-like protein